jgi:hypothetical protein
MKTIKRKWAGSALLIFFLSACSAPPLTEIQSPLSEISGDLSSSVDSPSPISPEDPVFPAEQLFQGLTYQQLDGNRVVRGRGSILENDPVIIPLEGEVRWLVGVPDGEDIVWTAALATGKIASYRVRNGVAEPLDLNWGPLTAGQPPMVVAQADELYLFGQPSREASEITHAVSLDPGSGREVFIGENGDLVLWESGEMISRLAVRALPDARLIHDGGSRLLFLSDPSSRYDHGVLGDELEAGSITLVETNPDLVVVSRIEIPAPAVIEGLAPIWADLDGDGGREILVTVSDQTEGARLVLYNEEGRILARGPAAGQGYRWRHQLAAAALGPAGEILIVDVLRPHLDATLEFFSWKGDRLVLEGELAGYSSHGIGSRNLDMALIGDLDGDGALEVVVPDLSREYLNGVGFTTGKAGLLWSVPLGGKLSSNLAGVTRADGSLSLGAGAGDQLLVWE